MSLAKNFVFFYFRCLVNLLPLLPPTKIHVTQSISILWCSQIRYPRFKSLVPLYYRIIKKEKEQKITHRPKRNPQTNTRSHSPSHAYEGWKCHFVVHKPLAFFKGWVSRKGMIPQLLQKILYSKQGQRPTS